MLFSPALSPQSMHIPDGFLSVAVSILFAAISVLLVGSALRRVNRELGERQVPLMGVLAAAIFAGQMLNFSVAGGTSGHLLGAALAAILLGPWPAVLVMTSVVSVQALLFQDGGILALGANVFNMAVTGVFVSYAVYRLLNRLIRNQKRGVLIGGFAAAWISTVAAALACGLQLALSGTSPANVAVPAMAGIHALIGIGEGLITAGALAFLQAARPDLLAAGHSTQAGQRPILVWGAVLALALAVLSPLASRHPDGLEWVAAQNGFVHLAKAAGIQVIPGYLLPGISHPALATIAAGVVGILIVFGVAWSMARPGKPASSGESMQR